MENDARKLKRLTLQLYHHIYDRYGEMEEEGVSEVVEEALILDIDVIEQEHRKEMEEAEHRYQQELENLAAERLALNLLIKGKPHQEVLAQTGLTEEHLMQLLK